MKPLDATKPTIDAPGP